MMANHHSSTWPGLRRSVSSGLALAAALLLAGCFEPFDGTRLEINLAVGGGMDRSSLILPTPGLRPGDADYFSHYEIHAKFGDFGMSRLASFILQPVIHVDNPCLQFQYDRFCVSVPENPCVDPINMQRFANLETILAMVSMPFTVSEDGSSFDHSPGYEFMRWPDALFADPTLTDRAEKLARANLVEEEVESFCDALPAEYYLGNVAQLTFPLSGALHVAVDGSDPRNGTAIGGGFLMVAGKLHGMTELVVTRERDPRRLSAENLRRTDLLPGTDGQVFLVGQENGSFGSIDREAYRGVTSVNLVSPYNLPFNMHVIVFEDIDEDPVQF
jgi:hypothetical protein